MNDDERLVLEWRKREAPEAAIGSPGLLTFLRERLEEYETEARQGRWHRPSCATYEYDLAPCDCGVPAWALADVAAKRLIITDHQPMPPTGYLVSRPGAFGCGRCHLDEGFIEPEGWCLTLRALVLPYADHPECHPSWLPPSSTG